MEHRCPSCQSLLYSRRSRVCGRCGAALPREMFVTDEDAQEHEKERAWARKLADQYDAECKSIGSGSFANPLGLDLESEQSRSPEELLRRQNCAEEFRHRKRPWFWPWLAGYSLFLSFVILYVASLFPAIFSTKTSSACLLFIGFYILFCWQTWLCASPICPNCRQNIRTCPPDYCHGCGASLRYGRCKQCGVDHTWTGWFNSSNGKYGRITYCPGCGVRLDTWIKRRPFLGD